MFLENVHNGKKTCMDLRKLPLHPNQNGLSPFSHAVFPGSIDTWLDYRWIHWAQGIWVSTETHPSRRSTDFSTCLCVRGSWWHLKLPTCRSPLVPEVQVWMLMLTFTVTNMNEDVTTVL